VSSREPTFAKKGRVVRKRLGGESYSAGEKTASDCMSSVRSMRDVKIRGGGDIWRGSHLN